MCVCECACEAVYKSTRIRIEALLFARKHSLGYRSKHFKSHISRILMQNGYHRLRIFSGRQEKSRRPCSRLEFGPLARKNAVSSPRSYLPPPTGGTRSPLETRCGGERGRS